MAEFMEFPKMARLSRECIVTEKIDGTNAQVFIRVLADNEVMPTDTPIVAVRPNPRDAGGQHTLLIYAGSRTRWITPDTDNHGFARWVAEHADDLVTLGPGRHFGEWWGSGIQRGYGLPKGEKRFSLFNVTRWALHGTEPQRIPTADPRIEKYQDVLPPCVGLVPVLWRGEFETTFVDACLDRLREHGSVAAPGFMNAEGVVVFHVAGNVGFKKTIEKDAEPKRPAGRCRSGETRSSDGLAQRA